MTFIAKNENDFSLATEYLVTFHRIRRPGWKVLDLNRLDNSPSSALVIVIIHLCWT